MPVATEQGGDRNAEMLAPARPSAEMLAPGSPIDEVFAPPVLTRMLGADGPDSIDVLEAAVPATMIAYRELDSLSAGFGVEVAEHIHPGPHRIPGYTVLSHGRDFGDNNWEAGVVLECTIPRGTRALWLAGYGDPCTFAGADLLLLRNVIIEFAPAAPAGNAGAVTVIEARVIGTSPHPERHRPHVIARAAPSLRRTRPGRPQPVAR